MKLNELKNIIRTTIKSEVRKAIREELTDIMLAKELKSNPAKLSDVIKKKKIKSKETQLHFTKNKALNEILNETVQSGGRVQPEEDIEETVSLTSNDAPNLRGRFAQLMGLENDVKGGGGTLDQNLAGTAAAMGRSPEQVPTGVANAITKDYSDVMKAIDEKKGK